MLDSYKDHEIQAHRWLNITFCLQLNHALYSFYSNNKAWKGNTEHFCRDHKKTLWSIWLLVFHTKWNWDISNSKECIQDAVKFIKRLFKSIIEWSEESEDSFIKDDITLKIKYYNDLLSDIDEKVIKN